MPNQSSQCGQRTSLIRPLDLLFAPDDIPRDRYLPPIPRPPRYLRCRESNRVWQIPATERCDEQIRARPVVQCNPGANLVDLTSHKT